MNGIYRLSLHNASSMTYSPRMRRNPQPSPVGWRLPADLKRAVAAYAEQTRRSHVGAAEVLLRAALAAAADRGEWTPPDPEENR